MEDLSIQFDKMKISKLNDNFKIEQIETKKKQKSLEKSYFYTLRISAALL